MAIESSERNLYWNYFLAIEEDVLQLARYIEFVESNMGVYSLELARLLFAASSEVDVVSKELVGLLEPGAASTNINEHKAVLLRGLPDLPMQTVEMPRFSLRLTPWANWATSSNPDWWRGYNMVKHHRNEHFKDASLKNVLNAVAGLFLLVVHANKARSIRFLDPAPRLCVPSSEVANIDTMVHGQVLWLEGR